MPETISLTEAQLGARLRSDDVGAQKAVFRAMVSAAQRGKSFIIGKSPVDRGVLRNAWKILKLSSQGVVELTNDQPYAGVMERGARPFKISKAGREALEAWVLRKIQDGSIQPKNPSADPGTAAKSIAFAISKKFARVGMKGKFFVRDNLPFLASLMDSEVKRSLAKFFNRPAGRKE